MSINICVVAVIENNNKILLVRETRNKQYEKSKGLWTLPAGKVERAEDLRSAVLREVKEEVGREVELTGFIGVYQIFSSKEKDGMLGFAFKAKLIQRKRYEFCEFRNVFWVSIKDMFRKRMRFRRGMREVLSDYLGGKILPLSQIRIINS